MQTIGCKKRAKSILIYSSIIPLGIFLFGISATLVKMQNKDASFYFYPLRINGTDIEVEVVKTAKERVLGLSGRSTLKENQGMLFVFDETSQHGMWMKDMNFPIDIVWLASDFKIVSLEKNVLPQTWPKIYKSNTPSLYVLELNAGWLKKHNVKVGEYASFVIK